MLGTQDIARMAGRSARVERLVPWICGRVLRTGANPAGCVDSPWATPRRCPPPDHTFAPLAHELHSTKKLLFCEEEDEDRSIWQHMMDSRFTLNLAANLSKDWGPPLKIRQVSDVLFLPS